LNNWRRQSSPFDLSSYAITTDRFFEQVSDLTKRAQRDADNTYYESAHCLWTTAQYPSCRMLTSLGKREIVKFFVAEDGQDLVEYTLLLAFVLLASAGLMTMGGSSVNNIWTAGSNLLSTAATSAS
jgi:Flp pilus assembly pilin Flp